MAALSDAARVLVLNAYGMAMPEMHTVEHGTAHTSEGLDVDMQDGNGFRFANKVAVRGCSR